jgi:hypothetical protein
MAIGVSFLKSPPPACPGTTVHYMMRLDDVIFQSWNCSAKRAGSGYVLFCAMLFCMNNWNLWHTGNQHPASCSGMYWSKQMSTLSMELPSKWRELAGRWSPSALNPSSSRYQQTDLAFHKTNQNYQDQTWSTHTYSRSRCLEIRRTNLSCSSTILSSVMPPPRIVSRMRRKTSHRPGTLIRFVNWKKITWALSESKVITAKYNGLEHMFHRCQTHPHVWYG